MQDMEKEIGISYNLDIKSITPYKDAFLMSTSKGKKVLRRCQFSRERVLFIHGAKEHLYKNDFKNIDRYMCTTDGDPFVIVNGSTYTVNEYIDGRECNFDNRNDIIEASRLLASMHKASRGYVPQEGSLARDELGKLPSYFGKRLDEIKKLKKVAMKSRNRFDTMFLEYADYFYALGEDAIRGVLRSHYEALSEQARKEGVLCHHDVTHRNLILGDGRMSIINFDFCCFELKVYDLANFIRRKMRKCSWNLEEVRVIINEYRSVEPISPEEFLVMKLLLQFPQKFWRVVNRYYNSKRSWSEKNFLGKLQEVIDEIDCHRKFIDKFDSLA